MDEMSESGGRIAMSDLRNQGGDRLGNSAASSWTRPGPIADTSLGRLPPVVIPALTGRSPWLLVEGGQTFCQQCSR